MDITSKKIDPYTVEVTKTNTVAAVATYDYGYLKRQRAQILASRDAELAVIDALIAEADKLGVVEKVIVP